MKLPHHLVAAISLGVVMGYTLAREWSQLLKKVTNTSALDTDVCPNIIVLQAMLL